MLTIFSLLNTSRILTTNEFFIFHFFFFANNDFKKQLQQNSKSNVTVEIYFSDMDKKHKKQIVI